MECSWGASAPPLPTESSTVEELHFMKDMSFEGSLLGKRNGDRAPDVVREIAVPMCRNLGAAIIVGLVNITSKTRRVFALRCLCKWVLG